MKNSSARAFSPISLYNCLKINKLLRSASLFAMALGIFLLPKTALMASITPDKILELTNQERAKAGLNELRTDDRLRSAAAGKAAAILQNQIFDHTINGRRFSAWIKDAGYKYAAAGENLAIDFITSEGVVKAWMASADHRANILDKEYSETGLAVVEGEFAGQRTIIVAEIFGAPLRPAPPIPADIVRRQERLRPWAENRDLKPKYVSLYYQLINIFYLKRSV